MTPSQLEQLPQEIVKLVRQLEYETLEEIVKRIQVNSEITSTTDYKLNRLHKLGLNKDIIKKYLNEIIPNVDTIFKNVINKDYVRYKPLYESVGASFIPFEDNDFLQQLVYAYKEQCKEDIRNITNTTGFVKGNNFIEQNNFYIQELNKSLIAITSGVEDYQSNLKKTIKEMSKSGLRTIDYKSGRHDTIEVATRRAVMTTITQLTQKINDYNAMQLKTDKFEVSWHATARPSHQVWQGRIYTKAELISICGLGEPLGLCGINCYHAYYPFIDGVSVRKYTDEQLDEMNAKENEIIEYEGKAYTKYLATQQMRRLENVMRHQRLNMALLKSQNMDVKEERAKYRYTMAKYKTFADKMGLPQEKERIYLDNLGKI